MNIYRLKRKEFFWIFQDEVIGNLLLWSESFSLPREVLIGRKKEEVLDLLWKGYCEKFPEVSVIDLVKQESDEKRAGLSGLF